MIASPTAQKMRRGLRTSTSIIVLLVWVALLALIAYNRQNINDWWQLRHYQAPPAVASLATDDTMTNYGRKILYVNRPQIQAKANFNECTHGTEQAAVLGCYLSNQNGIFVLAVSDPRLQGIEEVTAAHEMLHAAYDRLSAKEKRSINAQLQDYYDHDLQDQTIIDQMDSYKKTEPHDLVNEMHSVFGTEVLNLPAPLESYYRRYFTDRQKVVSFYNSYESEFTGRQAAVKTDDAQLAGMKAQIGSLETSIKTQYADLQRRQSQLNSLRQNGDYAAYNSAIPAYNETVDNYNGQVKTLKDLIDRYNQLVDARNSIALEAQQLTDEISTNVSPIGN